MGAQSKARGLLAASFEPESLELSAEQVRIQLLFIYLSAFVVIAAVSNEEGMNPEKLASNWTIKHRQTDSRTDRIDKVRVIDVDVGLEFSFLWVMDVRCDRALGNPTYCGLDNSTIQRLAGVDRNID